MHEERLRNVSEGSDADNSEPRRQVLLGMGALAATAYNGPVGVGKYVFGSRAVLLARPTDPDRLLDDPGVLEWNQRDDYMPYWAYLWPGAYLLAERVARGPEIDPNLSATRLEALEIGCGLGLAGLAAVARGVRVQFTDYDPAPLQFVARSAAENGFDPSRFATRLLDWRSLPDERFPLILGADVLYEARLVPLVANLLDRMITADGIGLIASPYRVAAERFPAELALRRLECKAEAAVARSEDGRLIEGTIYRVRRP
ncbi:MAG: class I SAM-dependent methyltransferase [Isosphaeraceae bacterium]